MIMSKWTCISKTPVTCNMIILKFSAFKNMWTCNVFCKALVKFNKAFIIKLFNKFFIIKLLQSFIKLLSSFYKAFIKLLRSFAKLIKPFQILFSRFDIYISWKYNRDSIDFKKTPPGKTLPGRCVEPVGFFHGRNNFSSRFFLSIIKISSQIQKPTKS